MTLSRRTFLLGAAAALAAPAVVRAESLMKLWVPPKPVFVVPLSDSLFGAAVGPTFELFRASASPMAGDLLGSIVFYGSDPFRIPLYSEFATS